MCEKYKSHIFSSFRVIAPFRNDLHPVIFTLSMPEVQLKNWYRRAHESGGLARDCSINKVERYRSEIFCKLDFNSLVHHGIYHRISHGGNEIRGPFARMIELGCQPFDFIYGDGRKDIILVKTLPDRSRGISSPSRISLLNPCCCNASFRSLAKVLFPDPGNSVNQTAKPWIIMFY